MAGHGNAAPAVVLGGRLKGPQGGRGCTLADMLAAAGKLGGREEQRKESLGSR